MTHLLLEWTEVWKVGFPVGWPWLSINLKRRNLEWCNKERASTMKGSGERSCTPITRIAMPESVAHILFMTQVSWLGGRWFRYDLKIGSNVKSKPLSLCKWLCYIGVITVWQQPAKPNLFGWFGWCGKRGYGWVVWKVPNWMLLTGQVPTVWRMKPAIYTIA